jgi:hypothetical protein
MRMQRPLQPLWKHARTALRSWKCAHLAIPSSLSESSQQIFGAWSADVGWLSLQLSHWISCTCREVSGIFNAKKGGAKVEKGVAFPTCVSVNRSVPAFVASERQTLAPLVRERCVHARWLLRPCSVVGHFSPGPDDSTSLKAGDVVKM